jgi:signal transduction histidine kinase
MLEAYTLSNSYLRKYVSLNDSIFKETSQQQINDFQVRYETAEKQLEIERQQSEIERHEIRQFIYAGGLIAAGLVLAMLVYIVVLRTRRNRELAEINAIKDKFFSIISHDLRNPALALRNGLQMLSEHTSRLDVNTLSDYCKALLNSANGLSDLLENLLKWATIQTGRMTYNPVPFNLLLALQPELNMAGSLAERKTITFVTRTPPSAIVTGDQNMLMTVVRNLLVNAVKFTPAGGTVTLSVTAGSMGEISPATTMITITDTGIGMTQEEVDNLFRIECQHTRPGTAGEQSSGLGLIVCRDLIHKHGRILHVESEVGKGSRFWFEV